MNTCHLLSLALLMSTGVAYTASIDRASNNTPTSCRNIAPCKNQDGTLDITFGIGGKTITDFGDNLDSAQGVVVLPCGKIVAAGFSGPSLAGPRSVALAGYTSYGKLDTSFGPNGTGKVLTDFAAVLGFTVPGDNAANALLLQQNCPSCSYSCTNNCNDCNKNCKIIVTGFSTATPSNARSFMIARYKCDGTLDTSFGMNNSGVTVTSINGLYDESSAAALQKDGKVVAVGVSLLPGGIPRFAIVRYNCDGSLDTDFGCDGSGIVLVNFNTPLSAAQAVQIQKNGKIVVGGISGQGFASPFDFALTRLNSDGTLDTSFGNNGIIITDFATVMGTGSDSNERVAALVLLESCDKYQDCCGNYDDNTKIIAVGFSNVNDFDTYDFALAGYTNNGQLDPNFGSNNNGLVLTPFVGSTNDLALAALLEHNCDQPCKIIAAGFSTQAPNTDNFALARYRANGTLDTTFGTNGLVTTDFNHEEDAIHAITFQRNGNIIAAGSSNRLPVSAGDFALARYHICTSCCIQK